jgi:hypothetical protein
MAGQLASGGPARSGGEYMKALFWIGMLVLILGVVSLAVPIPRTEREGFKAGGVSVGVESRHDEKVPPFVSALLILAGIGTMVAVNVKKKT